jgi:hypothetical protein
MNATANINMLEATRLTREGRLAEAMAILQGGLPSGHPSATSARQTESQTSVQQGVPGGSSIWCRQRPEEGHGPRRSSPSQPHP